MGGKSKWRTLHTRAYDCWINMRQRCLNPTHPHYHHYGGRGIAIHPDWDMFPQFLADMGDPPEGLTLERRDNAEGYSRHNCYWATMAEQNENKRPQKPRNDSVSGVKGVSIRSNGYIVAMTPQKFGSKILYTGRDLECAIAARKAWETLNETD
jgi:hypothetical protein